MITETVSKACPICGGQVCMVPTSRAYGFWCDDCTTMYAITENDLQKMCKRWWDDGERWRDDNDEHDSEA